MAKIRKGSKLVCVLCGREVVIANTGASVSDIWCCTSTNKMVPKSQAVKLLKKAKAAPKKKAAAKKKAAPRKKATPKKKAASKKKAAPKKSKKR